MTGFMPFPCHKQGESKSTPAIRFHRQPAQDKLTHSKRHTAAAQYLKLHFRMWNSLHTQCNRILFLWKEEKHTEITSPFPRVYSLLSKKWAGGRHVPVIHDWQDAMIHTRVRSLDNAPICFWLTLHPPTPPSPHQSSPSFPSNSRRTDASTSFCPAIEIRWAYRQLRKGYGYDVVITSKGSHFFHLGLSSLRSLSFWV